MKKLFSSLFLLAIFQLGFGQSIVNTKHDFSSSTTYPWNTTGEICIVCHTPHNGTATLNAPLWNHSLTSVTNYTLYTGTTMNSTPTQPTTGNSKLCLSCHDGTVGLGNFGGATGTSTMSNTIPAYVGTDLSNDHPISITYNTALATTDGGLKDPSANPSVAALLFGSQVECASCHDVHNNQYGNFLRMSNAGSALCLTCHNK